MENISDRYRLIKGGDRPSVYCIINTDTKRWWHYKQLRKDGCHKEARRLERQSIRDEAKRLRSALAYSEAYCTARYGKHCLQYENNGTISGYDSIDEGNPLLCRILGILTVDLAPLDETTCVRIVLQHDGFDHIWQYIAAGAIAYNLPAALLPSA